MYWNRLYLNLLHLNLSSHSPSQALSHSLNQALSRLSLCAIALLLMGCTSRPADAERLTSMPDPADPAEPALSQAPRSAFANPQVLPVTAQVELGGETIGLEVTRTPQEQALGLMYRERLPDDRGMLFSFAPPRPARFWMKNVVIDLDMVFVKDGRIVEIAADVPPCANDPCPTYGPPINQLIDHVIELRGGRAAELGLQSGDAVEIVDLVEAEAISAPLDLVNPETVNPEIGNPEVNP